MNLQAAISLSLSPLALSLSICLGGPGSAQITLANSSNTTSGGAGLNVSTTDLVNQGQKTFLGYTEGRPYFGKGAANDGTATNATKAATFYKPNQLPATLTFQLDVTANALGYDITQIDSFAGWQGGRTQTYANQNYKVEFSVVGSSEFTYLTTVDYSPFTSTTSNVPAYSHSSITHKLGLLATGVDAVRFVYRDPTISGGLNQGVVIQEIDILGKPTVAGTASVTQYGKGLAGKLGVPTLTASAAPKHSSAITVSASNSSGSVAMGMVLVGLSPLSLDFLGGRLLVTPTVQVFLPVVPGGMVLPFTAPFTGNQTLYVQLLQYDSASASGISMTPGLRFTIGK